MFIRIHIAYCLLIAHMKDFPEPFGETQNLLARHFGSVEKAAYTLFKVSSGGSMTLWDSQ